MQKGLAEGCSRFSSGKSSFCLNVGTNYGLEIAQHTRDDLLGLLFQLNLTKIKILILNLL